MIYKKLYDLMILISSLVSIILCLISGELILSILPIAFLLIYLLIIKNIKVEDIPITYYVYVTFSVFRLVVIPFFIGILHDFYINNVRLGRELIPLAISLSIYELFITSLCLYFYTNRKKRNIVKSEEELTLLGSRFFYLIFLSIGFAMIFFFPEVKNTLSLFVIKSNTQERVLEDIDFILILIRQIVLLAVISTFLLVSYEFYKLYKIQSKKAYLLVPLIIGIINTGFIIGERRSLQIYTMIITLIVLAKLFKKHKNLISYVVLGVGIAVLLGMTIYKEFYAFSYSGYSEAIKANASGSSLLIADKLQAYFYGIHTIAANADISQYKSLGIYQMFYDNIRSIIGSSLFLDTNHLITSQIYNNVLFGKGTLTGQLFSSMGYGYVYLGLFFSPIFTILNLLICAYLEKKMWNTKYLELLYLLGFVVLRIAFNIFSSPPPIINQVTLFAFPFIIVILSSYIFRRIIFRRGKLT